ncbi:tyrosine-type recombinase/integrase [Umezawaea sp. Da 62-37]|uniref:tyrosine-type recombinase/integrase n=1 Tax=Umezawaea sp. Da 62-37 TaxID=3075927 RepID=UPI0028F7259F|nr:tyrosine-type recombinase/integrase [Umezawaea sp. Da 62-37]WNV82600.1 tyrosine-type recombinase/integrase [Umezawaea sp. Da 62-37]
MAWAEQSGSNHWRVRFRRDDGAISSIPGFHSQKAAENHAADLESDQRRGTWLDPTGGRTTLDEWLVEWLEALDVDIRTEDNYRGMLRNHIRPRWGDTALADITNLKVQAWAKQLRATKLAPTTVAGFVKLLSQILTDAAEEKLITANPIRPRRRGRRNHAARVPEKVWADPAEVLRVADQIAACYDPGAAVLVVTAAWTGARWGELTGLQRHNLHLFDDDTGVMIVDPQNGALHESAGGKLWLGPPKTEASVRTIALVPPTVRLLRAHLGTHRHAHVFTSPGDHLHRRSNFSRRAMRPAADGNLQWANPVLRLRPVKPGLTFHGLRHSYKTWMIADGIPEIAQSLRLGHILRDPVQRTYSHVAPEVTVRLLQCLQDRWDKAVADVGDSTWRRAAQ